MAAMGSLGCFCPHCGAEVAADALYFRSCGKALQSTTAREP